MFRSGRSRRARHTCTCQLQRQAPSRSSNASSESSELSSTPASKSARSLPPGSDGVHAKRNPPRVSLERKPYPPSHSPRSGFSRMRGDGSYERGPEKGGVTCRAFRTLQQGRSVADLGLAARGEEMWASLAIAAMWVAVAVCAVWGPAFVSTSGAGTNSTTIPSGIAVALFASIGSWAVAKHAFGAVRTLS